MALTSITWNAVVARKWKKSTSFKALHVSVVAYMANPGDPARLSDLALKWHSWNTKLTAHGRTHRNSDRYIPNGALDAIAALVQGVALPSSVPAMVMAPVAVSASSGSRSVRSPADWLVRQGVQAKLEKCVRYACNDVGTFPQCIGVDENHPEYARIRSAKPMRVGMPINAEDRSWRAVALSQVWKQVTADSAGECTSFGYYAAHLLGSAENHPRVEIVTWEGRGTAKHVFCLLGRRGGTGPGFTLPAVSEWNEDVCIVDCWAMTLGWGKCVFTKHDYCFRKTMMFPATVSMDLDIERSVEGVEDTQRRLRTTGRDLTV